MWWSDRRSLLLGLAALPLAGCGFTPLYGTDAPARSLTGAVEVPELPGVFGFLLRERLVTRLGAPSNPRYRLDILAALEETERAIRADRSITRFDLAGEAIFELKSLETDAVIVSGTVQSFTAYSAVASPFATRQAEEDARRRIARELAEEIILRLAAGVPAT